MDYLETEWNQQSDFDDRLEDLERSESPEEVRVSGRFEEPAFYRFIDEY